MALIRSDEADIRLTINNTPYFESWQQYQGGALTATSAKTRGGGMGNEKHAGGPATRGPITVDIDADDVTMGFFAELEGYVGNGDALVSIQWLNADKTAIPGAHFTRTGKVTDVHFENADSRTNSPTVGMITVVIEADQLAK